MADETLAAMAHAFDPSNRRPLRRLSARLYDGTVRVLDRLGLGRLRRDLSRGLHGDVLEVGVGTGLQLPHHPADARITAIDPDAAALALAGRRFPQARLVVADAEALPFDDASFDWVVFALVLCTVRDPGVALAEARRVLRPGGRLRVLEHVRSPYPVVARAQSRVNPIWSAVAGGCRLDRPTADIIGEAGFAPISRKPHLRGHVIVMEAAAES